MARRRLPPGRRTIGSGAHEAIPALIAALNQHRPFAATALGNLGPATTSARPALEAAAATGPEWLRTEARQALRRIETNSR